MNITINIVEVATAMAEIDLNTFANSINESDYKFEFPNGLIIDVSDEETAYTEEAQKVFDEYYDEAYEFLEQFKQ